MVPPDPKFPPQQPADTTSELVPSPHQGLPAGADLGAAGYGPPPALSAAPTLSTILHAFRRVWKSALLVAVIGAAAAAAIAWALIPPMYTCSVGFRILSRPITGSSEDEGNFANVQKAQISLLKSPEIISEAIEKSRVSELYGVTFVPLKVAKSLQASFNDGPEMMSVDLAGTNPEATGALLTTISEIYPRKVNSVDEQRVKSRIQQLRRRLQLNPAGGDGSRVPTLAEQLRDKRIELAQAEEKEGLDDARTIAAKYHAAQLLLQSAQQSISKLRLERDALEVDYNAKQIRVQRPLDPVISDADVEDLLRNDQDYLELMREIALKRKKIDDLRRTAAPGALAALVKTPRSELNALENDRRERIEMSREKLISRRKALQREQLQRDVQELKDKIDQNKKQQDRLEAEVVRYSREVESYRLGGPKAPPEVEALRDQVKQLEKELAKIGDELAGLEGSLPLPPRITKHTEVFVPTEKEYGRPLKYSLAAAVLAFGMLLVGMCLLEATGKRVYASQELSQGLGVRILGTLPMLPASARNKTAQAQTMGGLDSQYGMTEAIDAIRTVLLHTPRADGTRVVMVTSALEGEGKTTLASHLAASLARAWRKTLLIDGDLRNPAQHEQFEQPLEPGLCEWLRGEVELDEIVRPTLTSRLWMIPAGKLDGHALQALAQDTVGKGFEHLKEQYDFIVLDTSPVLPVPDALLLGEHVDVVLLSVMKDHSRLPSVYQAQQRLEALDIRVLGSVVIGEKSERYGRAVPYPRQSGT
ncbi:MAG: polysaccharide biosynthesis tyrosine autokinase [Gemmataceae bacterium]